MFGISMYGFRPEYIVPVAKHAEAYAAFTNEELVGDPIAFTQDRFAMTTLCVARPSSLV